jgi:hypothetical protein
VTDKIQATDHMQIATAFSDEKEEQVSDNVLVIEISGLDFFSMEIADTPGLSSSEKYRCAFCLVLNLTSRRRDDW